MMKNAAVFKPSYMRIASLLPILFSKRRLLKTNPYANKFLRNEIHKKNAA